VSRARRVSRPRSSAGARRTVPRSRSPSDEVPAPPATSKEKRDAALRERGLLPPPNPKTDVSRTERGSDQLDTSHVYPLTDAQKPSAMLSVHGENSREEWSEIPATRSLSDVSHGISFSTSTGLESESCAPNSNRLFEGELDANSRNRSINVSRGGPPNGESPPTTKGRVRRWAWLFNMHRSVVGMFSRSRRSSAEKGSGFDADGLPSPPIPTFPGERGEGCGSSRPRSHFSGRLEEQGLGEPGGPRAGQAVASPFYSRARIIMEASAIEDEESRRLTELAYLG